MRSAIGFLLLLFLVIGFSYAIGVPLFEASDELWHYPMVKTLADGDDLPVLDPANPGPWRQEAGQPPLYYGLMGLATRWIDTSDLSEVRLLNPHVDNGVITADGNTNLAIHTPREQWPWRGTVLAVRLIRLLSLLLSAGTVYLTYRLALAVLPGEPFLALASAAVVAFTPMFTFISASVNNDSLAILLSTAILLALARLSREEPRPIPFALPVIRFDGRGSPAGSFRLDLRRILRRLLGDAGLGLLLGLAALTKESTLGLFGLAGLALFWRAWRRWRAADDRLQPGVFFLHAAVLAAHAALVFGVAPAVAGWWYYRNYLLYGDWLGWNAFVAVLGKRAFPASLPQLWGERAGFLQSYWGLFGGVNVPMPDWIYTLLNSIAIIALIGLVLWVFMGMRNAEWRTTAPPTPTPLRCGGHPGTFIRGRCGPLRYGDYSASVPGVQNSAFRNLHSALLLWPALLLFSLIRWATITWSSQGRLLFPAIAPLSILLVLGLATFASYFFRLTFHVLRITFYSPPATLHPPLFTLPLPLALFFLSALAPWVWIRPAYQPPPEYQGAIPNRLDANFGGEMALLGYELGQSSVTPGGSFGLTLIWRAETAMDRNWSVFVHLLGEHDILVAQRDTYPGLGLLPTRLARPGQTWADRYVVNVPLGAYPTGESRVEVGLYDLSGGARLPVAGGRDSLVLAPLPVLARPGDVPNPLGVNFGNQIELAGYSVDTRLLQAPQNVGQKILRKLIMKTPFSLSVFGVPPYEGQAAEGLVLTLYWRALRPVDMNYSVFAHIRGEGESLWGQHDGWPQDGASPTSAWIPGELVEDAFPLTLQVGTPPGVYDLEVGLYDSQTGERLQVRTPDGRWTEGFIYLARVRVTDD